MSANLKEIFRSRDTEAAEEVVEILKGAGIAYHLALSNADFKITNIGSAGDVEAIVCVPEGLYERARSAMEQEYSKRELPEDHFLRDSSDEELAEVVGCSSEWSPFDVAHAKRLVAERGVNLDKIAEARQLRIERLRKGKSASKNLILLGWIFSILGGFIGIGIAWSICFMKEKTPEGTFFTYDEESRLIGQKILTLAITVAAVMFFVRIFSFILSVNHAG